MKVLFIIKNREFPYTPCSTSNSELPFSSGLYNSVRFVVKMLKERGFDVALEHAIDNNCIDKLVTKHRPTHVVLEALWVVPDKFDVLMPLHPNVKWFVRLHSEVPFIANEGIALEWLYGYARRGVNITANSQRLINHLEAIVPFDITCTPNFYPLPDMMKERHHHGHWNEINIGCFGAVRPLKNHLSQALAAIRYADFVGKKLRFHINGNRVEGGGGPILKNLQALFDNHPVHELVEHDWLSHRDFKKLVAKMDVVTQVSFTETYNIVAADAVSQLVPFVSSSEIAFVFSSFRADPTNVLDIASKIDRAVRMGKLGARLNQYMLVKNSRQSVKAWVSWMETEKFLTNR